MVASAEGLRSAALLAALLALGTARIGHADDPRGEARAHYAKGLELAGQNGYEGALREFNAAYAISPQFAVLFNIGQAHIALGHTVEAIEALTRYLRDGGDRISPTRRAQVQRQIEGLRSTLPNPEVTSEAEAARATAAAAGAAAGEAIEAASEGSRAASFTRPGTLTIRCPEPGLKLLLDGKRIDSGGLEPRRRACREGCITWSSRPPDDAPPTRAWSIARRGRGAGDLRSSPGGHRPTNGRSAAADRRARVHGRHQQPRAADDDPREDGGVPPGRPRRGARQGPPSASTSGTGDSTRTPRANRITSDAPG